MFFTQSPATENILEWVVFEYISHLRHSKEQMFSLNASYFFYVRTDFKKGLIFEKICC